MGWKDMTERNEQLLAEYYKQKGEAIAAGTYNESVYKKLYAELIESAYKEASGIMAMEEQARYERKRSGNIVNQANENSSIDAQQREDAINYQKGFNHSYFLSLENEKAAKDYRDKCKDNSELSAAYKGGLDEGVKQAEKEKFMEQWNKKGKDQEPER